MMKSVMSESKGTGIVEARGLVKDFGSFRAVDGVDLDVPEGGCFGLLGPNGAGKTTMLRMILGQSRQSEGRLKVLGQPIRLRTSRVQSGIDCPRTFNRPSAC